jgi:hypothetical protein
MDLRETGYYDVRMGSSQGYFNEGNYHRGS